MSVALSLCLCLCLCLINGLYGNHSTYTYVIMCISNRSQVSEWTTIHGKASVMFIFPTGVFGEKNEQSLKLFSFSASAGTSRVPICFLSSLFVFHSESIIEVNEKHVWTIFVFNFQNHSDCAKNYRSDWRKQSWRWQTFHSPASARWKDQFFLWRSSHAIRADRTFCFWTLTLVERKYIIPLGTI